MRFKSGHDTMKIRQAGNYYPVAQATYIATIDELPDLIKVGQSMYVEARMKQLSSYYKLTFRLHSFFIDVYEGAMHNELSGFLYPHKICEKRKAGKEIFKCSIDDALRAAGKLSVIESYKRIK